MNKLVILLTTCFAILIATIQIQAQFGVKLGANLSSTADYFTGEDGESIALKSGFQGGVFYNLDVSEKFNLMVELNYEARGTVSKKEYSFNAPVVFNDVVVIPEANYEIYQEASSRQNYINLPILAVFGGEKFNYYIGPNIGFLISSKSTFERTGSIGGSPAPPPLAADLEDVDWQDYESFKEIFTTAPPEDGNFLNTIEFGINVGAMYSVTEDLFIDLRLNQGLSDVTNNYYDSSIYPDPTSNFSFPSRDDTDVNLSIQLSVGYSF